MKTIFSALLGLVAACAAFTAAAQVTLYQQERFYGPAFTANGPVYNLDRSGFNDRASSVIVDRGIWQFCEDSDFRGYCIKLTPGQYPSLAAMGLNNRISSLRRVPGPDYAYAPTRPPPPAYGYYPGHGERLYQANVVAVRAVTGPPQQRCWMEPQQVTTQAPQPNIPGAILGGVLGGVLGHQIGSGRGNDVATAIGAVGGAAVGANVNRYPRTYTQNVERCTTVPGSGRVEYWDVTYNFRGQTHRAQLAFAPGATITVNGRGEPRV
ncbi:MAG: glycine zipper 2TM domain-containing protein [Burkholderiales bacterium]|nr:glycine zipper 2TM domain-containing protein [Burkholderiales bacterium]